VRPGSRTKFSFRWFSNRIVILSGAPHRLIAEHSACGAESKDLGGAYLTHAARSFSTTEAENVDVSARHRKTLASLGSRLQEKTVAGPPGASSLVEKLPAAWVRYTSPRSFDSVPQALCSAINR
jgi:hypothetical protein